MSRHSASAPRTVKSMSWHKLSPCVKTFPQFTKFSLCWSHVCLSAFEYMIIPMCSSKRVFPALAPRTVKRLSRHKPGPCADPAHPQHYPPGYWRPNTQLFFFSFIVKPHAPASCRQAWACRPCTSTARTLASQHPAVTPNPTKPQTPNAPVSCRQAWTCGPAPGSAEPGPRRRRSRWPSPPASAARSAPPARSHRSPAPRQAFGSGFRV